MNSNPQMQGISRYWKEGEDDRLAVEAYSGASRKSIDSVLDALLETVCSRRRTKIVGFGVFEWKPWNKRLPTGKRVHAWSLKFKPGRYAKERYDGTDR